MDLSKNHAFFYVGDWWQLLRSFLLVLFNLIYSPLFSLLFPQISFTHSLLQSKFKELNHIYFLSFHKNVCFSCCLSTSVWYVYQKCKFEWILIVVFLNKIDILKEKGKIKEYTSNWKNTNKKKPPGKLKIAINIRMCFKHNKFGQPSAWDACLLLCTHVWRPEYCGLLKKNLQKNSLKSDSWRVWLPCGVKR